jgi:hypothetical protein
VIAIENTRLFEAEQTRTREVTERTRELSESLDGSCFFVATQVFDPTRGLQSRGLRLLATS